MNINQSGSSERIQVKIGEVLLYLGKLGPGEVLKIRECMLDGFLKKDHTFSMAGTIIFLKHSLKGVKGLKTVSGSDYNVKFEFGILSEETIDDLFNSDIQKYFHSLCVAAICSDMKDFEVLNGGPFPHEIEVIKNVH